MTAIRIGSLTFNASPSDYGAIRVDIITPGDRDFITLEPAEWQSLELAAASLSIAERRAESDRLEIARLDRALAEAREDNERLTKHGPWWMQYGLARLHEMVDLTDPRCPIGSALTAAGFERKPIITTTGEADAIEHEIVRLRREVDELRATAESWRQSQLVWQAWAERVRPLVGCELNGDQPTRVAIEKAVSRG